MVDVAFIGYSAHVNFLKRFNCNLTLCHDEKYGTFVSIHNGSHTQLLIVVAQKIGHDGIGQVQFHKNLFEIGIFTSYTSPKHLNY